jgi:hypothetical protein
LTILKTRSIAAIAVAVLAEGWIPMHVFAAPESTTPASPFWLSSATAVTVTSYTSPLIGDNGAYPTTSATIYNLFGATNTASVENGRYDVLFPDPASSPSDAVNTVEFTTPAPVTLSGVDIYLDSDGGGLDDARSVGNFTFTADGIEFVNSAPYNESIAVNNGLNTFMFAEPVTADTFIATFSDNPNIPTDDPDTGIGPRVYELDGVVPEPACISLMALGVITFLLRPRRLANSR